MRQGGMLGADSGRKWKVAVYTHSLPPEIDGVSRRFTGIVNELLRQGHDTIAFTLEKEVQEVSPACRFYHLDHCYVQMYPTKRLGAPFFHNFRVIYNALAEERPDVIHCVSDATTQLFALAGRLLNIPVVVSIHTDVATLMDTIGFKSISSIASLKDRCECMLADGVATTSSSFKKALHQRGVQAEHVIKTAVDMHTFHPLKFDLEMRNQYTFGDPDALLCVFVGRLSPEKSLLELIEWVTALPRAYLAIVGDGPMGAELAQYHGKENRVYCRPEFVRGPQVAKILASSDVHVSASQFETLGNTVLEAHSCGCPVVVPAAAGFVDTVSSGSDGFLYDPNVEGDATRQLGKLAGDADVLRAFGEAGRRKVRDNTIDCVVQDLLRWYARAEARRGAKSPLRRAAGATKALVLCIFLVVGVNLYFLIEACYLAVRGRDALSEGSKKGVMEPGAKMHRSLSSGRFDETELTAKKPDNTPFTGFVYMC